MKFITIHYSSLINMSRLQCILSDLKAAKKYGSNLLEVQSACVLNNRNLQPYSIPAACCTEVPGKETARPAFRYQRLHRFSAKRLSRLKGGLAPFGRPE